MAIALTPHLKIAGASFMTITPPISSSVRRPKAFRLPAQGCARHERYLGDTERSHALTAKNRNAVLCGARPPGVDGTALRFAHDPPASQCDTSFAQATRQAERVTPRSILREQFLRRLLDAREQCIRERSEQREEGTGFCHTGEFNGVMQHGDRPM